MYPKTEFTEQHAQSSSVDDIIVDPVTSKIYHIEKRPSEGGRNVIVRSEEGTDVVGRE